MTPPDALPGGRSVRSFLDEYWQQKPLLIREAFPDFRTPLTPEELAGLSLEPNAESRLILEDGGDYPWQLRYGPFDEDDFLDLPETNWTLLVQEVDRWIPEVAALLERFLFVPGWRLDDVMVSYAPDGGNVGAHIDNYDVFLIQALGQREWRIGTAPVENERLIPDRDVSMLADFEPDEIMTLGQGDMLYLPPRYAHHGIARGDCMTFSVGFRAPSHEDILTKVLSAALNDVDPDAWYGDPDRRPADHPGRIDASALETARRIVRHHLSDDRLDRWFGELVTEPKRGEIPIPSPDTWNAEAVIDALEQGAGLVRFAPNRLAFVEHADGQATLFAHGDAFDLATPDAPAASLIAGREPLTLDALGTLLERREVAELLAELVNAGHLDVGEGAFSEGAVSEGEER